MKARGVLASTLFILMTSFPMGFATVSGSWRWAFTAEGTIPFKALSVSPTRLVYVGSEDCCIYVLNITYDGYDVLWSWNASSQVKYVTHLMDHNTNTTFVVFGTKNGFVYCFKEDRLEQVWASSQLNGEVRYISRAGNNSTKVDDVLVCAGRGLYRIIGGGLYKGTIDWTLIFDKTYIPGSLCGVDYPVSVEVSPTNEKIIAVGVHTVSPTVGSCRTYCFNQSIIPNSSNDWAIVWTGFTTGTGSTTAVVWTQDITGDGIPEVVSGSGGYTSQGDKSDHGEITCFNGFNGSTIWTYQLSKPIYSKLYADRDYTGDGFNDVLFGSDIKQIGIVNGLSGVAYGVFTTEGTTRLVDRLKLENDASERWVVGSDGAHVYGVNVASAPFTEFIPIYNNVTSTIANLIAIEDLNSNGADELLISDGNQVKLVEGYGNVTNVPEFINSWTLSTMMAITLLTSIFLKKQYTKGR